MADMDDSALLHIAILAALEAGKRILDVYDGDDFEVEVKKDGSPLTRADRRANEGITEALAHTGIPLLSEEGRHVPHAERQAWSRFWLVDPLDGTKEFLKRNGEFTVNIALVVGDSPELGVVYAPAKRVLYFGGAKRGAFVLRDPSSQALSLEEFETQSLRLPLPRAVRPYLVVGSRSHPSPESTSYLETLRAEHADLELRSIGSSLKLCLVAEGAADVYPRFAPTMEWDTAAAHAVVLGAGGGVYRYEPGRGAVGPVVYNKENLLNPWFVVTGSNLPSSRLDAGTR